MADELHGAEVKFTIKHDATVVIEFGTIEIAFLPDQALFFAEKLLAAAEWARQHKAKLDEGTTDVEPGATGEYPRGKLNEDDEGELAVRYRVDKETATVMLDFGKPVEWIGLDGDLAMSLGRKLIQMGAEANGYKKAIIQ